MKHTPEKKKSEPAHERPPHIELIPPKRTREADEELRKTMPDGVDFAYPKDHYEWNLRIRASNGQVTWQDTQGYRDQTDAERAAKALIDNPPTSWKVATE
jgi:uncharacterized protein YegP (UPF0339 family)